MSADAFQHSSQDLVALILIQAVCFVAAWILTYAAGSRIRRGHWLLSLAYVGALEAGAGWLHFRLTGSVPGAAWWTLPVGIGLLTIVLAAQWNAMAHACMAATISLSLLFLIYIGHVTVAAQLGPLSLLFSLVLFGLQGFALLLLCVSSYEILDVLCRTRWNRTFEPEPTTDWFPRVSLHVPAYNEPPDMVIETLDALSCLDYPNYEVIVIDDNTTDEMLWRPVETHCRKLGFKFFHLKNWPGFKSGALNFALKKTDPSAQIVGVVDSDYVVEPGYLRSCVGFFRGPSVAFVQTPQDYRDVGPNDRYAMACYDAYRYFFKVSMASRNEHNGIIFAGTMGLIRRSVLESLGGWDEWCITEDTEISLRILDQGFEGIYIDRSFGRGLMPLNFEGLKKQRFRWAFGGMQILRRHWPALMPWSRWSDPRHRLTLAQKWDYLMGGLQWLNDPVTFGFTALLLLGTASLVVAHSLFIQPLAPAVLIVPFLFIFVGVSRFLWALRVRLRCGARRALDAFTILLGLTWVVTLACALGLVKGQGVFLRTPKKRTGADPWHTIRIVRHEAFIAVLCVFAAIFLALGVRHSPHTSVMASLLFWQSAIYGSALLCSYWAFRSEVAILHPERAASWRTAGARIASMVSDRRIGWAVGGLIAAVVLLYVAAVRLAPEREQIFRTNPGGLAFIPDALMSTPSETQVKAALYFEREAALKGSVQDALALWSSSGMVRDANYTAGDTTDDRVWAGLPQVRQRYLEEFARHRYLDLKHADASVIIEDSVAVVVNDLRAVLETPTGIQRVYLAQGDRWTLVREPDGWRIRELIVNRAPR